MINYRVVRGNGKNGRDYILLKLTFLLSDGSTYDVDCFLNNEQKTIFKFLATDEEVRRYLDEKESMDF